jgi:hypothetical protein
MQGGREHMRTAAETWGMWQWHGFYQQVPLPRIQ